MDITSHYFIEALHRGLRVLEAFSEERPTLSLVEIAAAVGLDKSTTFRFAYTLEALGYLQRDPDTKKYRPGLKAMKLGYAALNSLEITQFAGPYLKELCKQSQETVNMAVRDGAEIVYVARLSPRQIVNINIYVGSRLPVHCTSIGKTLLMDMSADQLRGLLGDGPYEALTENTITDAGRLAKELDSVRARGYAVGDEELVLGLRSVAAPIRQAGNELVAGLNVSVSSVRASRAELQERYSPMVVAMAENLSTALGR